MRIQALFAAAALFAVAACATTPRPTVLDAPEGPCAEQVNYQAAATLDAPGRNQQEITRYDVDAAAPCWAGPHGNTPYVVARLPQMDEIYILTVNSPPDPARTLALDVRMLGEDGTVLRHIERSDFQQMGDGYGAPVRPREGEEFVLVTIDPELIGETIQGVNQGIRTGSTGYYSYNFGSDSYFTYRFSYAGKLVFKVSKVG